MNKRIRAVQSATRILFPEGNCCLSRGSVAAFAKEWIAEYRAGGKRFKTLHELDVDSPFERAGKSVRALMPWLSKPSRGP